jgi:co-chaperonin GroES (HSP10)
MRATGFCVLVALAPKETVTKGGIIVPEAVGEREHMNQCRGRVASISPAAFDFAEFGNESPKAGDEVVFAKFAGVMTTGDDGREYRILQDKEILAVIEE